MCGRIYIKATLEEMLQNFAFASRGDVVSLSNQFPRYNGAPSLYYPIIIRDMVDRPYRAGEGDDQAHMAMFGWSRLSMAEIYTKEADLPARPCSAVDPCVCRRLLEPEHDPQRHRHCRHCPSPPRFGVGRQCLGRGLGNTPSIPSKRLSHGEPRRHAQNGIVWPISTPIY